MNEDARIDHRPYANMLRNHKARLIVLCLLSASELQISGLCDAALCEVGAFYWTDMAPDIVNPGREEQGSVSV